MWKDTQLETFIQTASLTVSIGTEVLQPVFLRLSQALPTSCVPVKGRSALYDSPFYSSTVNAVLEADCYDVINVVSIKKQGRQQHNKSELEYL